RVRPSDVRARRPRPWSRGTGASVAPARTGDERGRSRPHGARSGSPRHEDAMMESVDIERLAQLIAAELVARTRGNGVAPTEPPETARPGPMRSRRRQPTGRRARIVPASTAWSR